MFERALTRFKRTFDLRQQLLEMQIPTSRESDLLGFTGPDFTALIKQKG